MLLASSNRKRSNEGYLSSPQPVPITYTVFHDNTKLQVTHEQLYAGIKANKYPMGIYVGMAPGSGICTIIAMPSNGIKSYPAEKVQEYIKSKSEAIDKLHKYVEDKGSVQVNSILKELFTVTTDLVDVPQLIFILRRYTPAQRGKMLDFLFDKVNIGIESVIALLMSQNDAKYFKLAREVLGERYTKYKIADRFLFEVQFKADVDLLCALWESGVSADRTHDEYGTLVHIAVANEDEAHAINLLKAILDKKIPYNFAGVDGESKTLLILACKLRQHNLVKFLCSLYKEQGIDIGIDSVDENNISAIQYAAAVGCSPAFQCLLDAGADCAGVEDYLSCTVEHVAEILRSIHVEPDRDYRAPHNWLYNPVGFGCINQNNSPDAHKRVLISFQGKHTEVLRKAVEEAVPFSMNDERYLYSYLHQLQSIITELFGTQEKFLIWALAPTQGDYVPAPEGKSILDVCMEGQGLVQKCWERHQRSSKPAHALKL